MRSRQYKWTVAEMAELLKVGRWVIYYAIKRKVLKPNDLRSVARYVLSMGEEKMP